MHNISTNGGGKLTLPRRPTVAIIRDLPFEGEADHEESPGGAITGEDSGNGQCPGD
jgi:hypothetical protein